MHKPIAASLLLLLAANLIGRAGDAKKAEKKDDLAAMEKALLELTNKERKKKDLGQLTWSPVLGKVARAHAENMAKQDKVVHDLDGKTPYDRIRASGYLYYRAAENVGAMDPGYTLEELIEAWMGSKGHAENILQPEFQEAGMGAFRDAKGKIWFAQEFARPRKK